MSVLRVKIHFREVHTYEVSNVTEFLGKSLRHAVLENARSNLQKISLSYIINFYCSFIALHIYIMCYSYGLHILGLPVKY